MDCQDYLKPLFKQGRTTEPGNYRGLAIGSIFSKLFSFILLERLNKYIEMNKLISNNQIGFMKGCRTSDHIFLIQTIVDKIVKKSGKKLYVAFIDFRKAYDTVNREILFYRLKMLGIGGIFLNNIKAIYKKIEYLVTYKNGYLNPINSDCGIKQGCPLSPMLFNIYVDDISDTFDQLCDPVCLTDIKLNHILYADDLALFSMTKEGLQRSLDKIHKFAEERHLSINIEKSKTLIFNKGGKFIKQSFSVNNKDLDSVQNFCYLGYDINASGTPNYSIKALCDKAMKAMRPVQNAIARFNIPVNLSIRLFNTYISPILLYNVENWAGMSTNMLQTFTIEKFMTTLNENKASYIHRKFLKYILGVGRSCPNLAVYGETNEIPLILKGYRLMLKYWHRVSNLPDETLSKKALIENVSLRTNWISTIEKIMSIFDLSDQTSTINHLDKQVRINMRNKYISYWENNVKSNETRLEFYKSVKREFNFEEYLKLPNFAARKAITKIRCSDHDLEIEKGRHRKIPREARLCKLCNKGQIETEVHFLINCDYYNNVKYTRGINFTIQNIFDNDKIAELGNLLISMNEERQNGLKN